LYALWAIEFTAFAGLSLILPFIPLYVRELGISDLAGVTRWSGLLMSGPFLVSFLVTPMWGALGDRYGQKLMVVRALLGSALAYVGMALAGNVEALFGWRLALGAVSGFLAAGMALVSVTVPDGQRGYAMGLLQSVVPAAGMVGPLLGGVLADLIGYRQIFFVVAALCAVGGVVAASMLVETHSTLRHASGDESTLRGAPEVGSGAQPTPHRPSARENLNLAWTRADIRCALIAMIASQTIVTSLQPVFVLYVESLGVEPRLLSSTTGVLFAASGVAALIAAPRWGRRSDRLGFHGALTVAILGSAVLLLLQGLVVGVAELLVLRLLYGGFVSGILPPLLGFMSTASPPERRGGLMGLSSSAIMLGNLLGPLVGGFVAAHLGLRSVFFMSAAGMLGVNWYAYRLGKGSGLG
jgi:DHA1 family multidrug resistance protein-like MFS transporter